MYLFMYTQFKIANINPYLPFAELLDTLIESRDNGIFEFLKATESHLEQRIKEGEEYLRPNLIRLQKERANLVKTMQEQKLNSFWLEYQAGEQQNLERG